MKNIQPYTLFFSVMRHLKKWIFTYFHDFQETFPPRTQALGDQTIKRWKARQRSTAPRKNQLGPSRNGFREESPFGKKMALCHARMWRDRCNQTLLPTTSTLFRVENMITILFWLLVEVQLMEIYEALIYWRWPGNLVHCQDCVRFRLYLFERSE